METPNNTVPTQEQQNALYAQIQNQIADLADTCLRIKSQRDQFARDLDQMAGACAKTAIELSTERKETKRLFDALKLVSVHPTMSAETLRLIAKKAMAGENFAPDVGGKDA